MKVKTPSATAGTYNRVNEKDREEFEDALSREKQRQDPESSSGQDEAERHAVTDEDVNSAIEQFSADRPDGLEVAAHGTGPGLRVVLKDQEGAVVRQLTGEEFVRLREAVEKTGRKRGKILDQKL